MKKRFITSLLVLPLSISAAWAQDSAPAVKISGFGTGALTWTDNDQAEFARPNQASGVRKDPRTGPDSNLGLQADYKINDWLSATGQGLVSKDAQDGYGADLTWAFVKAKVSEQLSVRVGRMGLPVYMISDYRNVGYANTMLRPPQEVYSQVPIKNLDGIDATWVQQAGDTTLTAQLGIGRSVTDVTGGARAVGSRVHALNLVAEHGPFTLRAGYADAHVTVDNLTSFQGLQAGLVQAGTAFRLPQVTGAAAVFNFRDAKASFASVGLSMDWNNVVVQSEFAKRRFDNYVNATSSWYAMAGYRFGKLLPYASHARLMTHSDFANPIPTACPAGYPAVCGATVQTLYGTLEAVRANALGQSQTTDSIGLRWDAFRSADIKVQIDRVRPEGTGLFIHAQPGFHGPVTVGAIAVDFVF
jgi:hypothetical protein